MSSDNNLEALLDALENFPANGKIPSDPVWWALRDLGFIAEHTEKTPCKSCGTPRVTYSYWKPTRAGHYFLQSHRPAPQQEGE